jgi:hypothetical protein
LSNYYYLTVGKSLQPLLVSHFLSYLSHILLKTPILLPSWTQHNLSLIPSPPMSISFFSAQAVTFSHPQIVFYNTLVFPVQPSLPYFLLYHDILSLIFNLFYVYAAIWKIHLTTFAYPLTPLTPPDVCVCVEYDAE